MKTTTTPIIQASRKNITTWQKRFAKENIFLAQQKTRL